jgi:hypothetical protein
MGRLHKWGNQGARQSDKKSKKIPSDVAGFFLIWGWVVK